MSACSAKGEGSDLAQGVALPAGLVAKVALGDAQLPAAAPLSLSPRAPSNSKTQKETKAATKMEKGT